jgi:hypothetical protein
MKGKTEMKTIKTVPSIFFGAACALAFTAWLPTHAVAQPAKGAQLLMTHVTTADQVENLQPGDAVAMVCEKCKSVMVHNVTTEKGHIKVMTVGEKHLCPGCNSTITTVGTGKATKNEVKHVCEKCGSDSVFCCATKPGSATKGMKEEKK